MSDDEYRPIGIHALIWIAWCLVGALFLAAGVRGMITVLGGSVLAWTWLVFLGSFGLSAGWATLYHRSLRYALDDRHISRSSGVLWQRRRSIPLARITDIDVRQGPIGRLLGIGELWVFTHSTDGDLPEEKLLGIRHPDAVKDLIITRMEEIERREQPGHRTTDAEILTVLKDIRATLAKLEQAAGVYGLTDTDGNRATRPARGSATTPDPEATAEHETP